MTAVRARFHRSSLEPPTMTPIRTLDDLTPDALTRLLAARLGEARVVSVTSEPLGAVAGFVGALARVTLGTDKPAPALPTTLVAKLPTAEPGGRAMGRAFGLYAREIGFYRGTADKGAGIAVPMLYASALDETADEFVLLIEDLAGAAPGDQVTGLSGDATAATLDALGAFHARWWGSPRLSGDWLQPVDAPVFRGAGQVFQQAWGPFSAAFGAALGPGKAVGDALGADLDSHFSRLAALPRTLMHGDFRADNLMFRAGAAAPVVLDWQVCCAGPAVCDLAYLLSGSLTDDTRASHGAAALASWSRAIAASGVDDYPPDRLRADLPLGLAHALIYLVVAAASVDMSTERAQAIFAGSALRMADAFARWGASA